MTKDFGILWDQIDDFGHEHRALADSLRKERKAAISRLQAELESIDRKAERLATLAAKDVYGTVRENVARSEHLSLGLNRDGDAILFVSLCEFGVPVKVNLHQVDTSVQDYDPEERAAYKANLVKALGRLIERVKAEPEE